MLINILILIFALINYLKYSKMEKENIIFVVEKELKKAFRLAAIKNNSNMTKVLKSFIIEYTKANENK